MLLNTRTGGVSELDSATVRRGRVCVVCVVFGFYRRPLFAINVDTAWCYGPCLAVKRLALGRVVVWWCWGVAQFMPS
jgi:hypothetical protein